MVTKLNQNYRLVLETIAEYRILTVNQLAIVVRKGKQMVRRYLRELREAGLIQIRSRGIGRSHGRPENVASLTDQGVDLLRSESVFSGEVSSQQVTIESIHNFEHQIMLNWFRVNLVYIEKKMPKIVVHFLTSTSPFLQRDPKGKPIIFDYTPVADDSNETVGFTPDGVWLLTDKERDRKFLFFLEVDMGTESIISPQHNMRDIQQKLLNYGSYFDNCGYTRYEQIWDCKLTGFRLLFLTHTVTRLTVLCNLVKEISNTDFVWLTELSGLFEHGAAGNIWVRGGHLDVPRVSIFGSLSCSIPVPD